MTDQMKATMNVRGAASARPEVAATARRRQFCSSEKRRSLTETDRCTEPGEIEALLRREGIYSSNPHHLAETARGHRVGGS
jgi:transposase